MTNTTRDITDIDLTVATSILIDWYGHWGAPTSYLLAQTPLRLESMDDEDFGYFMDAYDTINFGPLCTECGWRASVGGVKCGHCNTYY